MYICDIYIYIYINIYRNTERIIYCKYLGEIKL